MSPVIIRLWSFGQVSRISFLSVLLAAVVAGCTPAPVADKEARAREATASALGAAPAEIVISKLESGTTKSTWQATTGGKTYECDADERLRLPDCREAG
jgi:hypothetical protein